MDRIPRIALMVTLGCIASFGLFGNTVSAQTTLELNGSNQIIGVKGLDVNGTLYDVDLLTSPRIFNDIWPSHPNPSPAPTFWGNETDAQAARIALNNVLQAQGNDPYLPAGPTLNLDGGKYCYMIPFDVGTGDNVKVQTGYNRHFNNWHYLEAPGQGYALESPSSTNMDSKCNWARFTPAAPQLKPTTDEDLFCVDETTTVNIDLSGIEDLYGYMLKVNYDDTLVSVDSAVFDYGFFDTNDNGSTPPSWDAVCATGTCTFAKSELHPEPAVSGSGTLAKITFKGLVAGEFDVTISDNVLSDIDGYTIAHDIAPLPLTVCGWAKASGTVSLQGRATPKGTAPSDPPGEVTAYDGFFALSTAPYSGAIDPDTGDWLIENIRVMPGGTEYTFDAAHSLYLGNQTTYTLNPLDDWDAGPTRLLGGDANNDGTDDIGDLGCIGGAFGLAPVVCGTTGSSDINWDGTTNIQDLAIAGGNYTKGTPQPW
jgi:hypothetical protein